MKDAAAKVTIPGASTDSMHDRRFDYRISCHPVTVNVAMRDLLAIEKQQEQAKLKSQKKITQAEKGTGKRSSIRAKLERNKAIIAAGSEQSQKAMHIVTVTGQLGRNSRPVWAIMPGRLGT